MNPLACGQTVIIGPNEKENWTNGGDMGKRWQIMLLCLILCAERKRPWSAGVLGVNGTSRKNASGQWLGCRETREMMASSGL